MLRLLIVCAVIVSSTSSSALRADDVPPPPLEPGIALDEADEADEAPAAPPVPVPPPPLSDCTCADADDDDDDEPVRPPPERWPVPLLMLTAGGTALVSAVGLPLLGAGFDRIDLVPFEIRRNVSAVLALGPFLAPAIAGGAVYAGGGVDTVIGTTATGYGAAVGLAVVGAVGVPIVLVNTDVLGLAPEGLDTADTVLVVLIGIGIGGASGFLIGEVLGSAAGPAVAAAIRPSDDVDEHE